MRNRRITVSLSESDYNVLKRLSELQGEAMSKIVSGLVETVTPVLSQMVDNFERLQAADEFVREQLRISAEKAYSNAQELAEQANQAHGVFSKDVETILGTIMAAHRTPQGDAALRRTCGVRKAAKGKTAGNGNLD